MSHRVEVFLFGEKAEADVIRTGETVRFSAGSEVSVKQASPEKLNELADKSQSEFIAFLDGPVLSTEDDFVQAVIQFDEQPDVSITQVSHSSLTDPFDIFQKLPLKVAVLVRPPESVATILFRKSTLSQVTPFADVSAPIWNQVIRSVFNEDTLITLQASCSAQGMSKADDFVEKYLPVLAPEVPGRRMNWLLEYLQSLQPEQLVSPITSPADALAVKAGLLQIHDYLDESHEVSQSLQGRGSHAAGDYWHGIMHRREPDDSNAKYWFRRVGQHPIFPTLAVQAETIFHSCSSAESEQWHSRCRSSHGWEPSAFIDFCSYCRKTKNAELCRAARRIQWVEMLLLLEQTCRDTST